MDVAVTQRLATACARRPWRTVGAWVLVLVLAVAANVFLLGSALTPEGGITTQTDATRGRDLVQDRFPNRDQVSEYVVVVADSGTVDDTRVRETVATLRRQIVKAEGVRGVGDPYPPAAAGHVTQDGKALLVPVVMDDLDEADAAGTDPLAGIADVIDAVHAADRRAGVSVDITGSWTVSNDFIEVSQRDLQRGELQYGLPAALIVLLLVPDIVLRSLAFGAVLVGIVTVASALTLLPAIRSLLGDRIERWRIPFLPQQHGGESRFWTRAVSLATRRPAWTAGLTTALLLLLALPVLTLETGSAGRGSSPSRPTSRPVRAATRPWWWSTPGPPTPRCAQRPSGCATWCPVTAPSVRRPSRPHPEATSPWWRSRSQVTPPGASPAQRSCGCARTTCRLPSTASTSRSTSPDRPRSTSTTPTSSTGGCPS